MPVYEYEPTNHDCFICEGRLSVIQGINEDHLKYCPHCGLDVKRIVSKATFKFDKDTSADNMEKKGMTTYRRAEKGVWEKVGGEGVDVLVGDPADMAAIEAEKAGPAKVLELDQAD